MEEVFTPIERAALSKRMVYSDFACGDFRNTGLICPKPSCWRTECCG
jgi:hypothetical protein